MCSFRSGRPDGRLYRVAVATALAVGVATAAMLTWRTVQPRTARAQNEAVSIGLDQVDEAPVANVQDAPSWTFDGVAPDRVLPIQPFQKAPPDVDARVRALAGAYDQATNDAPELSVSDQIAVLPDDPDAPPRMDSGDPNPDRINVEAPALRRGRLEELR